LLVALLALAGAAAPDAAELLRRVATQYRNAGAWTVEAQVSTEQGSPGYLPSGSFTRNQVLAVAPGGRYSFASQSLRMLSDGQTVWTLRSDLKEYTEQPAGTPTIVPEQVLFSRFGKLDTAPLEATIKAERDVKHGSGRRRAYIVHLRPRPPQSETWTEELWVDAEKHIVLRSVFREVAARLPPRTRTITFDRVEFAAPDPALFVWTAPPGARKVDRFREPAMPDSWGPGPLDKQGP
jgi:outer membrane lipoprotein-sorting protein